MKKIIKFACTTIYTCLLGALFAYTILQVHGYGYDRNDPENRFGQMGVLDISVTNLRGNNISSVDIYLNDGLYGNASPSLIWLHPGRYKLTVVSKNYQTWEENIQVELKNAVQRKIIMIPKNIAKKTEALGKDVEKFEVNPDNSNQIAYINKNSKIITIINTAENNERMSILAKREVTNIAWQDNVTLIYKQINGDIYGYDFLSKEKNKLDNSPSTYKKYFGKKTEKKEESNYIVNDLEINQCNPILKRCTTITRFSTPIIHSIYVDQKGFIIQTKQEINFCSLNGICQKIIERSIPRPLTYIPKNQSMVIIEDNELKSIGLI